MSDFDETVGIEPEPTPEPATEPVATPEPEPAEDPWYVKAGFDSEEAALKKVSNLTAWEREVNAKAAQAGRQKPAPEPVADTSDPFDALGLDSEQAVLLRRAIESVAAQTTAPTAAITETMFQSTARQVFDAFVAESGVDADTLTGIMDSHGLWPTSPDFDALRYQLDAAAAIAKVKGFDPEAERERIREQVMAELKSDGARVKAVEPAKATPQTQDDDAFAVKGTQGFMGLMAKAARGEL